MVKAFQDDKGDQDQDFEIDKISKTRIANVARAFAWWVAKDCSTIAILKVMLRISKQIQSTGLISTNRRLILPC